MGKEDINFEGMLDRVADEFNTTPSDLVQNVLEKRNRVHDMLRNDQNKFRVLGIDKFDGEDWVAGEFDSSEDALEFAKQSTEEAKPYASNESIATVYYAYTPSGEYLGNVVPKKEEK